MSGTPSTPTAWQPYEAYKPSGVEWLGDVPEHWEVKRNRFVFVFSKGLSITKENLQEDGIPCINYGEIHSKYGFEFNPTDNELKCAAKEYSDAFGNCLLNEGDFVFADTSEDYEGSGNFSYLNQGEPAFAGYHTIIARPLTAVNSRFFAYVFDSVPHRLQIQITVKGVKVFSISQGVLKDIYSWMPSLGEQTTIAEFLDKETARMDELIAQKVRFIELLREKRQAVITHAVTKGLDPNAPMKPSGVEWLGDVPEHWEVKRNRFVFVFSKGLSITKENLQEDGIPCINYGEIHSKYGFEFNPTDNELKCAAKEYSDAFGNCLLNEGDFVFADTSEDYEGSGNFSYLNQGEPAFAGYHTIIARPLTAVNSRFFAYVFDSVPHRLQIQITVKGVKVFSISQGVLKDIYSWMPSLGEQTTIVEFLDQETARIDAIIRETERSIELLKEHRSALITAAVTGKIKVA